MSASIKMLLIPQEAEKSPELLVVAPSEVRSVIKNYLGDYIYETLSRNSETASLHKMYVSESWGGSKENLETGLFEMVHHENMNAQHPLVFEALYRNFSPKFPARGNIILLGASEQNGEYASIGEELLRLFEEK